MLFEYTSRLTQFEVFYFYFDLLVNKFVLALYMVTLLRQNWRILIVRDSASICILSSSKVLERLVQKCYMVCAFGQINNNC
jgi:hypothetical protein